MCVRFVKSAKDTFFSDVFLVSVYLSRVKYNVLKNLPSQSHLPKSNYSLLLRNNARTITIKHRREF